MTKISAFENENSEKQRQAKNRQIDNDCQSAER